MTADGEAAALLDSAQTCPFFDSECRNLVEVPDVARVFEQRASGHQRRLEQLANGESNAQAALREATDAERQMGDLSARRDALDAAQRDHTAAQTVHAALRPVAAAAQDDDAKALEAAIDAALAGLPPEARPTTLSALRGGWSALLNPSPNRGKPPTRPRGWMGRFGRWSEPSSPTPARAASYGEPKRWPVSRGPDSKPHSKRTQTWSAPPLRVLPPTRSCATLSRASRTPRLHNGTWIASAPAMSAISSTSIWQARRGGAPSACKTSRRRSATL